MAASSSAPVRRRRSACSGCEWRASPQLESRAGAAEVLGDYGAGPNHTLPTGGTARSFGGLSVFTFLRTRTWMRIDDAHAAGTMISDAKRLGEMEGLFGRAVCSRVAEEAHGAGGESPRLRVGTPLPLLPVARAVAARFMTR